MYKSSIRKIYGYCRWNHEFPSDNWCLFGISQRWYGNESLMYNICFFGFELRLSIDRKWYEYKNEVKK